MELRQSSNVIPVKFRREETIAPRYIVHRDTSASVTRLIDFHFPIYGESLDFAPSFIQLFFRNLRHTRHIELHLDGHEFNNSTYLSYHVGEEEYTIIFNDFLSIVPINIEKGEYGFDLDDIEKILEKLFSHIGFEFQVLYFSPLACFGEEIDDSNLLENSVNQPLYEPGEYFYGIEGIVKEDEEPLWTDIKDILDNNEESIVLDILVAFLEEKLSGITGDIDYETVNICLYKYDYRDGKTYIQHISLGEFLGVVIGKIREKHLGLRGSADNLMIIREYLQGNKDGFCKTGEVIPLGKNSPNDPNYGNS